MRGVVWIAALAVVGTLMAGCADEPKEKTTVALSDGSTVELAEGGALSGVVVDEAIRPLAGANVTVLGPQITVATDASGLFVVPDLDPGIYTLSAAAPDFIAVQTTAEVIPGETAKVRIVLPIDKLPKPYHTTYKFDWFVEADAGAVGFTYDLANRELLNNTLPAMCEACYFYFQTDGPAETFVLEAIWEDAIPDPTGETNYYWILDGLDSDQYKADYFASPGRVVIDAGPLGNGTRFGVGMTPDENWVAYQQQAELFVTAFYLAPPPEGWSVVNGDV